jgi:hypothetical protein
MIVQKGFCDKLHAGCSYPMEVLTVLFLLIAGTHISCAQQPQPTTQDYDGIVVSRRIPLHGLSSASGLGRLGDGNWLIVGDDDADLHVVDDDGTVVGKATLQSAEAVDPDGRINKDVKRDYEALATYDEAGVRKFIALGSGSKVRSRTYVALGAWLGDSLMVQEYQASDFYAQVMGRANIAPAYLNIEGAVVIDDRLLLLNREDNQLLSIDLAIALQSIVNQGSEILFEVDAIQIDLPDFAGVASGLSGACVDSAGKRLYFCASIEDKTGTIQDGQILGSCVGWMEWDATKRRVAPRTLHLVDEQGNRTFDKLESLEILDEDETGVRLAGVTDDDTGGSEWLEFFIPIGVLQPQILPPSDGKD